MRTDFVGKDLHVTLVGSTLIRNFNVLGFVSSDIVVFDVLDVLEELLQLKFEVGEAAPANFFDYFIAIFEVDRFVIASIFVLASVFFAGLRPVFTFFAVIPEGLE